MSLLEIRKLYLSGKWTKNDLHALKGFKVKDVEEATKGLTRRVKYNGEVETNFSIPDQSIDERLRNSELNFLDINIGVPKVGKK